MQRGQSEYDRDYEAGEGSGVVLSYGQGVLLYCSSAGELTFTGDFPVSSFVRLSAGENLVMTEEWSGGTVADIWNDLLPGTVSRLFTWDGGFRSSFTQGQGAGVELDEFPVLIRARASAVIQ
ncbi:MAG: hypothetical protein U5N86_03085 [Planctomycetota bacterium]|nr:hypothetical protein [Planctomycetota bacterium]